MSARFDPLSRPMVGIDTYSYHRQFGDPTRWETPEETKWTVDDVIRRGIDLHLDALSFQTLYLPPFSVEETATLHQTLTAAGIKPTLAWGHRSGLEGGSSPAKVEAAMDALAMAQNLGCSVMRIVCGEPSMFSIPASERRARLTPIVREIAQEGARRGLTVAIENHGDLRMGDVVGLIEDAGEANLGVCFDSVNAIRVGDDLLEAARLAAPLIAMVHFKDAILTDGGMDSPGDWWPNAPLGRGHIDLYAFLDVLLTHGYRGTLFVEIANLHTQWTDEDAAAAESVATLRRMLDQSFTETT